MTSKYWKTTSISKYDDNNEVYFLLPKRTARVWSCGHKHILVCDMRQVYATWLSYTTMGQVLMQHVKGDLYC